MAPLPQNNTDRLWLWYTAAGIEHSIIFRFDPAVPQADQVASAADFANAMKGFITIEDSFFKVTHQDAGSVVSFPLAWTAVAGTANPGGEVNDDPHFLSITGRSLDGRRCKLGLYAPALSDSLNYRIDRVAGNPADLFLDAVEAMEPGPVSISGNEVLWNQYANIGYNAYWQRQARKSG